MVAVRRQFIAQHFLVGSDWGAENHLHSHHYQIELQLSGTRLDEHRFLVDIQKLEKIVDGVVSRYSDQTLNLLPNFNGLNPSLEQFAQLICVDAANMLVAENWTQINVKLWENDIAWVMVSTTKP